MVSLSPQNLQALRARLVIILRARKQFCGPLALRACLILTPGYSQNCVVESWLCASWGKQVEYFWNKSHLNIFNEPRPASQLITNNATWANK